MRSPLGKNEIGKFLNKTADNAGFQRAGGKLSNHSVRKTSISRLLDANTPEIFVAQLSGLKNLQSLQSYKSASEQHQFQMTSVLSGAQSSFQIQPRKPLNQVENFQSKNNTANTSSYMSAGSPFAVIQDIPRRHN